MKFEDQTLKNEELDPRARVKAYPKDNTVPRLCAFRVSGRSDGKLRYFKLVNGLSYERLGEIMGRDPEQLTDWLSGRLRPCRRNIESIALFLAENKQG